MQRCLMSLWAVAVLGWHSSFHIYDGCNMIGFDDCARVMIATMAAVRMIARIANVIGVFATPFAH